MIIVIEGIDGSGKSTQILALKNRLENDDIRCHMLDFPRYYHPGGQLAKMYLQGAFGKNPSDVNPYAASSFYAVDRISSYLEDWQDIYKQGRLIISDRYTTSNATHHGSKFPPDKRAEFFDWLFTFEHDYLGLPRPDLTILLDMPVECVMSLMGRRGVNPDIHERDTKYLQLCRESALHAAELYNWRCINCVNDGKIRSQDDITDEIYTLVREIIC